MPEFKTHVGLILRMETKDKTHLVTLVGERAKVLYEGEDLQKAKEVYDYTKEHYSQREIAAAADAETGVEPNEGEERSVPYVRMPD